jgi:hypothetical protein
MIACQTFALSSSRSSRSSKSALLYRAPMSSVASPFVVYEPVESFSAAVVERER